MVGTIVSLPVMVVDVVEAWSHAGQCYPRVTAVDADHATLGVLNMWDFPLSDFDISGVYMFRGLKVGLRRVYNEEQGKWERSASGGKVLECSVLTAIERVVHDAVQCYFP